MKPKLIKAGILIAVFIVSLFCFSAIINGGRHSVNSRSTATASQPVLFINMSGTLVNPMRGFKSEINDSTYRDSVTLLPTDRTITVEVMPNGNEIKELSYQITSVADGTVVENGRIKTLTPGEVTSSASFTLNTPINMNQEYTLRFKVDTGNGVPIYYYTRLLQRTGQNMEWYFGYVLDFYTNCVNKQLTDSMISQLETDVKQSNSSMHYVTLGSASNQIIWGNLETFLVKPASLTVLEINETTVSIGLNYIVGSYDEAGKTELYSVKDYYRMRKAQDSVVLLDYERTADEIFDGDRQVLTDRGINLGMVGKDVNYVSSDSGNKMAFEQAGELWEYQRDANKVEKIFSFHSDSDVNESTEKISHSISISSVNDEGDVAFVVYGYMPTGEHEGRLGISIRKYDAKSNVTNELLFIETKDSYEMMKQSLSKLAYISENDQCFLYYNNKIYVVDLTEKSISILKDNLDWQSVSVSKSQNLVAWSDGPEGSNPTSVVALNLKTGETITFEAPEGDYIKAQGYVGEDLIYGMAHAEDCYIDAVGNEMFAMYRVCICAADGSIVKDYQMDTIYVNAVSSEADLIILSRVQKVDGAFVPIYEDRILHYEPVEESNVFVDLNVSERKGTQVNMVFSTPGETTNLLSLLARYSTNGAGNVITEPSMVYDNDYYYVYAKGGLYGLYTRINAAISAADEQVGIVLNPQQQYIWERGNVKAQNKIAIEEIPPGLLAAPIDETSVAEALGEDYNILNLSGCSVSALRYQISNGYAVVGKWSPEENKLIAGYDAYNIWVFDPATGGLTAIAFEDAEAMFGSQGNIFISYHKK